VANRQADEVCDEEGLRSGVEEIATQNPHRSTSECAKAGAHPRRETETIGTGNDARRRRRDTTVDKHDGRRFLSAPRPHVNTATIDLDMATVRLLVDHGAEARRCRR
jgi:hypothetical protein